MGTFAKIPNSLYRLLIGAKKLPLCVRYPVPFFISVCGKETIQTKLSAFRYFLLPVPIGAGGRGGGRRSGEKGVGERVERIEDR
jgi:hypothetical protein